jgi:SAM-dependent methyltransferase
MPPKPRSAEYFDGWYADRVATPTVDEIMNRHMGFPPDTRAGVVPAEAIPELAEELRLTPGSTEQAARMGVSDASFRVGELTAAGLPDASVEAVLGTDAIQFPDEPASAYDEIRRVLKPGGRVVLTSWEPLDRSDERLSVRVRRANLSAGLHQAGFTDVEVRNNLLCQATETTSGYVRSTETASALDWHRTAPFRHRRGGPLHH